MTIKLKVLALSVCLFIALSNLSYASPSMGESPVDASVFFSETQLNFSNTPFIINGEIMVSAESFFEKIGAQVLWYDSTQELVSYMDNIYIKFKANSNIAYVNGRSKSMPIKAMRHRGELFVPATFAASMLDLTFEKTSDNTTLALNNRIDVLQYQQIGFQHYKRLNYPKLGISVYVPDYWHYLDEEKTQYGIANPYENYSLIVQNIAYEGANSRSLLSEARQSELVAQSFEILSTQTIQLSTYKSDVIRYRAVTDTETTYHIDYIFYEASTGYLLRATYPDDTQIENSESLFNTIANTFNISKLTINDQLEHYTEYDSFFTHNVILGREIYSNMTVNNQFSFRGSLSKASDVIGFHVIVTLDTNRMDYYIPVTNGTFQGIIYTPFGLGKHNITIVLDTLTTDETVTSFSERTFTVDALVDEIIKVEQNYTPINTLMKFSVLNTSNAQIKYLLPTEYVNYDTADVYNLINSLTFNLTNEYAKASVLYDWVVNAYDLTPVVEFTQLNKLQTIIGEKIANPMELSMLYTGLLRASNIPARIVRGTTESGSNYWVETYLNGKWGVASINDEINENSPSRLYFNVNRSYFYENFITVDILPF